MPVTRPRAPRTLADARAAVLAVAPEAGIVTFQRRHGRGGRVFSAHVVMLDFDSDGMIAWGLTERDAWIAAAKVATLPACGRCGFQHATGGACVSLPGEAAPED